MTAPAQLQAQLKAGEDLLWHSPAAASLRLSDYGGVHELIARLFLGLSTIMAVVFFVGMQGTGQMGLSGPMLFWVAGPIVMGLLVRQIGRRRLRSAALSTVYGVTSHRILVANDNKQEGFLIQDSTTIDITFTTPERDVLAYSDIKSGDAPAHLMQLPKGEAENAQTVINLVKASL